MVTERRTSEERLEKRLVLLDRSGILGGGSLNL
jgi:hypothetical protein